MDVNAVAIGILTVIAVAMGVGWNAERKYTSWLERENTRMGVELFALKTSNADLSGENRRLKRELESDASGHIARDPETGRFIKEQSE